MLGETWTAGSMVSSAVTCLGRTSEAAAAYASARSLTANPVEQAFLDAQRAALGQPDPAERE